MDRESKTMVTEPSKKTSINLANLGSRMDSFRQSANLLANRAEDVVKRHPFYAVLGAAALGVLVSRLISRYQSDRLIYRK